MGYHPLRKRGADHPGHRQRRYHLPAGGDTLPGAHRRGWADVGAGCFGDPWLFAQLRAALAGEENPARAPLAVRIGVAEEQFALAMADKGEHIACLEARKYFSWYLRGVPYSNYYKERISKISSAEEVRRIAAGIRRDLHDAGE